jgi:periplasmic divalent cation tolerance protein
LRIIFATCSAGEAEPLAERLLAERLIGCANLVPGARSLYHWQGELCRDEEVVMLMETTAQLADAAVRRLGELHSYDVPKIITLEPAACEPAYRAWLNEVTGA